MLFFWRWSCGIIKRRSLRSIRRSSAPPRNLNGEQLESRQLLAGDLSNASLPLLQADDLQYVGAFRVPVGTFGGSTFSYGGKGLGFNSEHNSLFVLGHDQDQEVAEIAIPEIVNSSQIGQLKTATFLQPFTDLMSRVPDWSLESQVKIGDLLVVDGELVVSVYEYYDGDMDAIDSHFKLDSLDLDTANVAGLFQVGELGGGFVGGYMTSVPQEWQQDLGAPYLTGQAKLAIIGRTSAGPAAFGFDPADLGSTTAPATPDLYYPLSHPLAPLNGAAQFSIITATTPIFSFARHSFGVVLRRPWPGRRLLRHWRRVQRPGATLQGIPFGRGTVRIQGLGLRCA